MTTQSVRTGISTERRAAAIVGALFIVATAAASVSVALLDPILGASDLLGSVHSNTTQVLVAVLSDLVLVAAVVAIPILLFPYLEQHRIGVARGYLAARMVEGLVILVGAIVLATLVTVSRESVEAGASIPGYQAVGATLLAARDWTDLIGTQLVFGFTALVLNYSLFYSKLVPRFISVWGFIGALLAIGAGLWGMLSVSSFGTMSIVPFLPIAVNEMVLAVWLIAKGFSQPALASPSRDA